MNAPLINIQTVLATQNSTDTDRDKGKWSALSLSHGQQSGAEGIIEIIDRLQTNDTVHFFTDGAWSLYQLVIALLEITGPAKMYASTYAMSETSTRSIAQLKEAGKITGLYCVIDDRVDTRSAGSFQLLTGIADKCTTVKCHAKATVLEGAKGSVLIIGSANYTENRRVEIGIVTTNIAACNFHKGWIKSKL